MKTYWLKLDLLSDTHFGRGDGVAGLVNAEVQHDSLGLPYLGGKTLKGILGAMCAEILFALEQANMMNGWQESGQKLFGNSGSNSGDAAILHVGNAQLPEDLQTAIAEDLRYKDELSPQDILESLTTLRRQTAMDAETGAPKKDTLRTLRLIQRGVSFIASLNFTQEPEDEDLALLAACVKAFRRVGTNRNRGIGRIKADLYDTNPIEPGAEPKTDSYFGILSEELTP